MPTSLTWRAVEVVGAILAITAMLPVIVAIAMLVKLGTPGPVLFWQPRVGQGGRVFQFVKFRTMYADARQRFPELYAYDYHPDELQTLRFKVEKDPRVTPTGRWLRKTSLDELPNFINVLRGEMSLVGPRPEIPEMLSHYDAFGREKFRVRPGVTGLAQVAGRGHLTFPDTVSLDVEYVHTRSLALDLRILLRTFVQVCRGVKGGAF